MRGFARRIVGTAAFVCVLVASVRPARADAEETEYRLKTAGVPDALRPRIHAAIRKAAEFLMKRQHGDGSFGPPPVLMPGLAGFGTSDDPGYTALCSLALAHAATPASREAAARGIAYLLPGRDRVKADVYDSTYTAGLTAMLLRATHREPAVGREIALRFAKGVGRTYSGWGYVPWRADRSLNLSTAQFGALGMWAGDPSVEAVGRAPWLAHLQMLVDRQAADGAWSYTLAPRGKERLPRGVGYDTRPIYPTGTFMGLANLALARAGAGDAVQTVPGLAARSDAALDLALAALDREGPHLLEILRGEWTNASPGYFPMYDLYALEKACVFTARERVGGRAWYVDGAEWLVDVQERDGGFGTANCEPELVRTSFALLFLLRASETYRADTPRDVDAPAATTPSGGDAAPRPAPPPPPPVAAPSRPPVPLAVARDLLDMLAALLADRDASDAALVDTIGLVDDANTALAADTPAADAAAWRADAEKLLLRAFALDTRTRTKGASARRAAVQSRAASALGRCDPRVAPEMRRTLERGWLADRRADVPREAWSSAFDALAALGGAESAAWIEETVLTMAAGTVPDDAQAAAMDALRRFPALPGKLRREIAVRVVTLYAPAEARVVDPAVTSWAERNAAMERWGGLSGPAVRLLRHLAADPSTGTVPGWTSAMWSWKLADFRRWLDDHEDLARAPWKG